MSNTLSTKPGQVHKALLRKVAARTKEELEDAIANAIEKYPADQCANYFKAYGYASE